MTSRRQPWADLLTVDDWKRDLAKLNRAQPTYMLRGTTGQVREFPTRAARDSYIHQLVYGTQVRTFAAQFK